MTIEELDAMCSDVCLDDMLRGIGLDLDSYAGYAMSCFVGCVPPDDAADFARICALIGFMYGKLQNTGGTTNEKGQESKEG